MNTTDPVSFFMHDQHAGIVDTLSQGNLSLAREAWLLGDFDTARMAYQKTAYISGRLKKDGETKKALKRELGGFAQGDPLYREVLSALKAFVERQPGIKQTDLYGHFPSYDQATLSYVLYFAAELFDLVRKKSGRTYQIFPPGRTFDA